MTPDEAIRFCAENAHDSLLPLNSVASCIAQLVRHANWPRCPDCYAELQDRGYGGSGHYDGSGLVCPMCKLQDQRDQLVRERDEALARVAELEESAVRVGRERDEARESSRRKDVELRHYESILVLDRRTVLPSRRDNGEPDAAYAVSPKKLGDVLDERDAAVARVCPPDVREASRACADACGCRCRCRDEERAGECEACRVRAWLNQIKETPDAD